jgi:predicted transcriptional regulator
METAGNSDLGSEARVDLRRVVCARVNKGIAAADRGRIVEHSDLRKLIDGRYPG